MLTRLLFVAVTAQSASPTGTSREAFEAFERALRSERPAKPAPLTKVEGGLYRAEAFDVTLPDGRTMPLFVLPPPAYDPARPAPLMLAMHGGPTGSADQAVRGALQMVRVWIEAAAQAGYVIASPAMTHVVVRGPRTEERLPYEILRADHIDAVLREATERYAIDPNRIVSTGISLGSNFSMAYAASRPGRLSAIVPVSTEGESRETLVRNLMHVPTFVLEGSLDPNIRDIQGPRAFARILEAFRYDFVYEEMGDRGHEGFQEHYPGVLEWISERPRNPYPLEVLRVPHDGIMPLARRAHWIETDTRAGLVRAKVSSRHRIDIDARFTRSVTVLLHDRLVDLDARVDIRVNGERVFHERVERSTDLARELVASSGDTGRTYAAAVRVDVPDTPSARARARTLTRELAPSTPAGVLSFWESYAVRSLEDRLPPLGATGTAIEHGRHERSGVRLDSVDEHSFFGRAGARVGDVVIAIDGEPFFAGGGLESARAWLVRELTHVRREIAVTIVRNGEEQTLRGQLALAPF